jgi:hypothetical protein
LGRRQFPEELRQYGGHLQAAAGGFQAIENLGDVREEHSTISVFMI